MPRRIESPSSINTYKQCPRKYFYQYIKKLPTYPNIHTVRGNAVHEALEKFFEIDPDSIDPLKHKPELAKYLSNLFDAIWSKRRDEINKYSRSFEEAESFYNESRMMLGNWLNSFFNQMNLFLAEKGFTDAFRTVSPAQVEALYQSERHHVKGYIDAVMNLNERVKLVDYKTSKPKKTITPEYRLQLSIYALMYKEKHGKMPEKASIWFLKDKEVEIDVDDSLINDAIFEIEQIHASTDSDYIRDYPCKITPLCKWSTGQCNFYDVCIKERRI